MSKEEIIDLVNFIYEGLAEVFPRPIARRVNKADYLLQELVIDISPSRF